jgi:hypothetical protein
MAMTRENTPARRTASAWPSVLTSVFLCGIALLLAATALAVPKPDAPNPSAPTEAEKRGLAALHRNTVEIFIAKPGFGLRRMAMPLNDVVKPPESLYDPNDNTQAEPKDKKEKPGHYSVQELVANGQAGRVFTDDKKEHWKVLKVQLVGLVKNPDPVVYLTPKSLDDKEPKKVSTRELDAFETTALEALNRREDL